MPKIACLVDDKHVPLYRVIWISNLPHYCGEDDCTCEGRYEIRLEQGESVWGTREDRDNMLNALGKWQGELNEEDGDWP